MARMTTVRFGAMRQRALFSVESREELQPGDVCVVRSSRGEELGTVLARPVGGADDEGNTVGCADGACGSCARPRGKVVRLASEIERGEHLEQARRGTRDEILYARERAAELGVELRIIDAEYLLGRAKLLLHYTASGKADLQGVSKEVGRKFDTRIEFLQVGARDEARLVGDVASCGRELCCRTFLHDLKPVSMRMAKQQKKTLDPTKIAGQCGKLKCCLRYEDEVYVELQKTMPRRNSWVECEKGIGKVLSIDLLLQKVVVDLAGKREVLHVSDLLATGLQPPKEGAVPQPSRAPPRKVKPLVVPPRPGASGAGEEPAAQRADGPASEAPAPESSVTQSPGSEMPGSETPGSASGSSGSGSPAGGVSTPAPKRRDQEPGEEPGDGTPESGGPGGSRRRRRSRRRRGERASDGGPERERSESGGGEDAGSARGEEGSEEGPRRSRRSRSRRRGRSGSKPDEGAPRQDSGGQDGDDRPSRGSSRDESSEKGEKGAETTGDKSKSWRRASDAPPSPASENGGADPEPGSSSRRRRSRSRRRRRRDS